ncbi:hypothetical protein CH273_03835 [Rhodococcus sp. 05-339-2]|uniref:hypothetical protein n=1 Tax=Rhodococcoides fascians TaxID=1828 RepID=UPI00068F49B9|nr:MULTISPECIES: hypothetical protein [Rhodococcus]OZD85860.1 hypothetical protein CH273_03835 [Rhodococcus sp. 05-339-2]
MAIALGIHVGAEEVSAVLVEADLPELGAISTRTVSVAAVPGGVGDAVTTMLGIMRVQAAQNDLRISGSGVVCDSIALCGIVRAALAAHEVRDVVVVDAGDPRLNAEVPLGVAAALIGTVDALTAWAGGPVDVPAESVDEVWNGSGSDAAGTPRGARLTMIGLGVGSRRAERSHGVGAVGGRSDPEFRGRQRGSHRDAVGRGQRGRVVVGGGGRGFGGPPACAIGCSVHRGRGVRGTCVRAGAGRYLE